MNAPTWSKVPSNACTWTQVANCATMNDTESEHIIFDGETVIYDGETLVYE